MYSGGSSEEGESPVVVDAPAPAPEYDPSAEPAFHDAGFDPPPDEPAVPPAKAPAPPPPKAPAAPVESRAGYAPTWSLESAPKPTGPVSQAWSSSAGAIAPPPAQAGPAPAPRAGDAPSITPPPAEMDLSVPKLPSSAAVGVGAPVQRDSAAIKRILRAVSGAPAAGKGSR